MAQTFDIRFARSAGLAGLFEAPANTFRWKGAGRLSIDASGISIAMQRGLLTFFARTQSRRIATNNVTHVYREGNALRLEFSTRESTRAVLPFWVSDRDAAARIVTLLPTQRSVEVEDSDGPTRKYRIDRKLVAVLVVGAVMLGAVALTLSRYLAEDLAAPHAEEAQPFAPPEFQDSTAVPEASVALTEVGPPTPESRTPATHAVSEYRGTRHLDPAQTPAPSKEARTESVATNAEAQDGAAEYSSARAEHTAAAATVAVAHGKTARDIAIEQLSLFRAESNILYGEYLYAIDSLAYERLEAIEARWLLVTSRIVNTREFASGEFYALREMELAISRSWRDYLRIHAASLRRGNSRMDELSAAHFAFAVGLETQLSGFAP